MPRPAKWGFLPPALAPKTSRQPKVRAGANNSHAPTELLTPNAKLGDRWPERTEQVALFRWRDEVVETYPEVRWLYAIPNGVRVGQGQATRLVEEGLHAGHPDVALPCHRIDPSSGEHYMGVIIEMKRPGGGNTDPAQRLWMAEYWRQGWWVAQCHSAEAARDFILSYLVSTRPAPPRSPPPDNPHGWRIHDTDAAGNPRTRVPRFRK